MEQRAESQNETQHLEGLQVSNHLGQDPMTHVQIASLREATISESLGRLASRAAVGLSTLPAAFLFFRKEDNHSSVVEAIEQAEELGSQGQHTEALTILQSARDDASDEMKSAEFLLIELNKGIGTFASRSAKPEVAIPAYAAAIRGMETCSSYESYEIAETYAFLAKSLAAVRNTNLTASIFDYAQRQIEDALLVPIAPERCCDASVNVFNEAAQFYLENGDVPRGQQALSNALSSIYRTMGLLAPDSPRVEAQLRRVCDFADIYDVDELTMETPVLRQTVKLHGNSVAQVLQYRTDQFWR